MIGTLVSIIIALIVVGVVWWAINQLLPMIPLPEPFRQIIYVLMVVVLVFVVVYIVLQLFGGVGGTHLPLLR